MEQQVSTERRSRFRRTSIGKRLELSSRDRAVFALLAGYPYLNSRFLHAFAGGSLKRFIERLGDLFHEGYLDRPAQQWATLDARYSPAIYSLTAKGEKALDQPPQRRTLLAAGPHRQFAHSLLICEILASIELAVAQRADLRFISWEEIVAKRHTDGAASNTRMFARPGLGKAMLETITPDGLFGLQYVGTKQRGYRFFALEVDRDTMPLHRTDDKQSSFGRKLLGYERVMQRETYKHQLGLPNLFVLTITIDGHRTAQLRALSEELLGANRKVLFSTAAPALGSLSLGEPVLDLIDRGWERVGAEDFVIAAP